MTTMTPTSDSSTPIVCVTSCRCHVTRCESDARLINLRMELSGELTPTTGASLSVNRETALLGVCGGGETTGISCDNIL